jgi:hypothetical protein
MIMDGSQGWGGMVIVIECDDGNDQRAPCTFQISSQTPSSALTASDSRPSSRTTASTSCPASAASPSRFPAASRVFLLESGAGPMLSAA